MHLLLERGVSFAINTFEFPFCKNDVYCPSGFGEGDENVKYIHTYNNNDDENNNKYDNNNNNHQDNVNGRQTN